MASRNPPNRLLAVFPGGSGGATVRDGATSVDVAAPGTPGIGKKPVRSDPGGQGNRPPGAPSSIRAQRLQRPYRARPFCGL